MGTLLQFMRTANINMIKKLLVSLLIGLGLPILAFGAVNLPTTVIRGDMLFATSTSNLIRINCIDGKIIKWASGIPTCATDQSSSGGGATTTITSNIISDGPDFVFATSSTAGMNFNITGSGATLTFTPQLQSGYNIPLTASTTEWSNFYTSPSTRITAGQFLAWNGNTLTATYGTSTDNTWSGLQTFTNTGTTTFGGSITLPHPYYLTTHGLRGDASDGLYITANNFTAVANFGVGNTANTLFNGAVNIDGATRLATSLTGILKATAGAITVATDGTDYLSAYNVISANGLISVSTTTALATLTASTSPYFTNLNVSTNASTTHLTVSTNSYLGTVRSGMWNGSVIPIAYGGLATSTAPALGQVLLGNASGGYDLVATSSLGFVSGSGLTSLNGLTGDSQTFATSTSGGIDLFITSATTIHTFTLAPSSGYTIPLTASTTAWNNLYLPTRFGNVASTTISAYSNKSYGTASTTFEIAGFSLSTTMVRMVCQTKVGTVNIHWGNGTTFSDFQADTNGATSTPSISFVPDQMQYLTASSSTAGADGLTCQAKSLPQ